MSGRKRGPRDGRDCIGCPCCRTPLDMGSDYCERCQADEHSDVDPHDAAVIIHWFRDHETAEEYACGQSYGNGTMDDGSVNCPACLSQLRTAPSARQDATGPQPCPKCGPLLTMRHDPFCRTCNGTGSMSDARQEGGTRE